MIQPSYRQCDKMSYLLLNHHPFKYILAQKHQYPTTWQEDGEMKKMEEENKHQISLSKMKVILGALSLLTVFSTPYLNITQISFNMTLFQSAAYSFLILGFWVIAGKILRPKHSKQDTITFPKPERHYQPVASI